MSKDSSRAEGSSPTGGVVALSYLAVAIFGIAAWLIYTKSDPDPLIVDVDAFAVFAPMYIAAQAIERFLEPLAALIANTTEEKLAVRKARQTVANLGALPADDPARAPAEISGAHDALVAAEAALARKQAKRGISLWAFASSLGMLICSMLGLGLITAISKSRPDSEFIRTVDVLLTGLAIGAGTKPLHDLIARIEKAKDNADSATTPTAPTAPTTPAKT